MYAYEIEPCNRTIANILNTHLGLLIHIDLHLVLTLKANNGTCQLFQLSIHVLFCTQPIPKTPNQEIRRLYSIGPKNENPVPDVSHCIVQTLKKLTI